ncbi:hypothetical protein RRU94_18320 [Domibacillus sp. DTU_2020_1001157_1_SI_ALB_TIR_016]|nr:hypothetical protein [Domibacillus sp. DTU_2020_1001157_1_SI_ALB_TIR_016]WNS79484.1 hypothetical protein RRU94_18320 [Domibacillus sp. DTU_2020_1001157_1_SI_ALB_TIR_016]
MLYSRAKCILLGGTILSSVLNIIILILTVIHHITIQEQMDDLKKNSR